MSMSEWAKQEVAIACKRKAPNIKEVEWDYGCACYESALKAYMSLISDEHSHASFSVTKNVLIKLMNGKPLTPIEDTKDVWNDIISRDEETGAITYQCKRMPSLFKTVYPDGKVSYSDVSRYYCYNISEPNCSYKGGGASEILDELFPITMPYYPHAKPYIITCEEYLTDRKNGDFDTKAFLFITAPNGIVTQVNRYFGEVDGKWTEISKEDFDKRAELHNKREEMEKKS